MRCSARVGGERRSQGRDLGPQAREFLGDGAGGHLSDPGHRARQGAPGVARRDAQADAQVEIELAGARVYCQKR